MRARQRRAGLPAEGGLQPLPTACLPCLPAGRRQAGSLGSLGF